MVQQPMWSAFTLIVQTPVHSSCIVLAMCQCSCAQPKDGAAGSRPLLLRAALRVTQGDAHQPVS
jgi:hypothetical protein